MRRPGARRSRDLPGCCPRASTAGRRGRAQPFGRRAPAGRHRPCHAARCARAASGRGDRRPRSRERGRGFGGARCVETGRTVVVVAHRLHTIRHADRIAVIEAGRLIGSGRHEELNARCALYMRLGVSVARAIHDMSAWISAAISSARCSLGIRISFAPSRNTSSLSRSFRARCWRPEMASDRAARQAARRWRRCLADQEISMSSRRSRQPVSSTVHPPSSAGRSRRAWHAGAGSAAASATGSRPGTGLLEETAARRRECGSWARLYRQA